MCAYLRLMHVSCCVLNYMWFRRDISLFIHACSSMYDSYVTYHYSFMRAYPCMIHVSCSVLIYISFTFILFLFWSIYHFLFMCADLHMIHVSSCVLNYIYFTCGSSLNPHTIIHSQIQGHVASGYGWLVILCRPCRSGGDEPWICIPLFIHRYGSVDLRSTFPKKTTFTDTEFESAYHYSFTLFSSGIGTQINTTG